MAQVHGAGTESQLLEVQPPVIGAYHAVGELAEETVRHGLEQRRLVAEVAVHGGRVDAEFGPQASERDCLGTLAIGEADVGVQDGLAREADRCQGRGALGHRSIVGREALRCQLCCQQC